MTPPRAARSPFTLLTPIVIGVIVASAAVIFLVFLVIPSRGNVDTDAQRPDAPAINAPGVSELPKPKQEGHPINRINEPLFLDPTNTPEELAMVDPTSQATDTPTVQVEFSSTPRVIRTPTATYSAPIIIEQPTTVWVPTEAPPPAQPPPPVATNTPPPAPTATRNPPTIAPELTTTPAPPPPPATATPAPSPTADLATPTLPPLDPTGTVPVTVTPTMTATATVPIIEGPPVTGTPPDLTATPETTPGKTDTPTPSSTPKSKKKRTHTPTPDVTPSSGASPTT